MGKSNESWDLLSGATIRRVDLHARYGGSGQGGISPSAQTPNVLIFTDPVEGRKHGYDDEWVGDTFYYIGAGQRGDQSFDVRGSPEAGNRAIRDHRARGLRLRLFKGSKGTVLYIGEFVLDDVQPFHYSQAPETGRGPLRRVIRFHLRRLEQAEAFAGAPVGRDYRKQDETVRPAPPVASTPDPELIYRNVYVHRKLQNNLADRLADFGMQPLSPRPEDPEFDLAWSPLADVLTVCEVKSLTESNETAQLRMGLGQVLDYVDRVNRRDTVIEVRGVLWIERAPTDPRWIDLCQRVNVTLAWPGKEGEILRAASA